MAAYYTKDGVNYDTATGQPLNTTTNAIGSGSVASDLFNVGSSYLLGREGEKSFEELGAASLAGAERLGNEAMRGTRFKPFGVTSNLANVETDRTGGFNVNLSPEMERFQNNTLGKANDLFADIGQDPTLAAQEIYDMIRAVQQPDEERALLGLQESLFAGGRGGVQTAMYGGTPEQFAYNKAQQEAMNAAALSARGQVLAEEEQRLTSGLGMLNAGYTPQDKALEMLGYGTDVSNLVGTGQRAGSSLRAQLGSTGLESSIQAAGLGLDAKLSNYGNIARTIGGGSDGNNIVDNLVESVVPSWLSEALGLSSSSSSSGGGVAFNPAFGSATAEQIAAELQANPSMTPAQIAQKYPA